MKTKILIGVVVAAIVSVVVIVLVFMLKPSVKGLLQDGKYSEAYEKANSSQKDEILMESVVAFVSSMASELLKTPSSFELIDAYCDPYIHSDGSIGCNILLYVSAESSNGNTVTGYFVYFLSKEEWKYYGTTSELEEYSGDSISVRLIKESARRTIDKGTCLSVVQIERINRLFEGGMINSSYQINWSDVDTSNFRRE